MRSVEKYYIKKLLKNVEKNTKIYYHGTKNVVDDFTTIYCDRSKSVVKYLPKYIAMARKVRYKKIDNSTKLFSIGLLYKKWLNRAIFYNY